MQMKKALRIAGLVCGSAIIVAAAAIGGYVYNNLNYFDREMAEVWRADFVERQVTINGRRLNYAEGPANGPALVLIHGQAVDWMNYARVLPELSRHYHVFAVDCYGHGASARAPERYSASAIGGDLAQFIQDVVGEPAVISGHSSGGLVTIWLAAYVPEQVRGVILEDPPIFTTRLPRAASTWNYLDLATTAHNFLQSGQNDFVAYNAEHARFWTFFGDLQPMLIRDMLAYHNQHPQDAVKIYYMPPVLNEIFRGLTHYDPQFGEAFYTGTWDTNFDHADALTRITVPAVLIHTNWSYNSDGILLAAMDADDAERARSLLQDVVFIKVDSGHGFHFEKPDEFIQILLNFQSRLVS